MGWLVAELNEMMAEEEVIDMVLENLVVGNSNIANHGVLSECVKSVSCPEDCQGHCRNINNIIIIVTLCKWSRMTCSWWRIWWSQE